MIPVKHGLSETCYLFFSTLANPTRLAILELLRNGPRNVTEITEIHDTNPVSSGMAKGELGWQVENLPPGFSKINEVKRNFSGKSVPVGHITLSDGIAAVSVFIKPVTKNDSLKSREYYPGQGAINIYTRTVGDNVVTTIGEVPSATVMQIGNSVKNYKVNWTE